VVPLELPRIEPDPSRLQWPIHPEGTIDQLSKEHHLGPVEESTAEKEVVDVVATKEGQLPTLAGCLNLDDFEVSRAQVV
jgi:hypothetical protein